jgi:hypothetical protein
MRKKISDVSGDPPRRVMEAATTMPLEIPEHLEPTEAREQLLDVLLMLALAGDVRAAKLYLDYSFKSNVEAKTGLSLEEALRIMQTSSQDLTAGDDDFE